MSPYYSTSRAFKVLTLTVSKSKIYLVHTYSKQFLLTKKSSRTSQGLRERDVAPAAGWVGRRVVSQPELYKSNRA